MLVTAAASGVGSAAVQIAKQRGAFVIGSASAGKLPAVQRARAPTLALDRDRADFVDALRAATDGRGVDAIVDFIGGSALARHQACLAERGRLVLVGLLGGASAPLDLARLLMKRQRMCGLVMRSAASRRRSSSRRASSASCGRRSTAGALSPRVDQRLAAGRGGGRASPAWSRT